MKNISIKNLARAIFESSVGKDGDVLDSIIEKSFIYIRNNNLLGKKKEILSSLEDIINKENGILKVKVSTSTKLKEESAREIENFIKKKYNVQKVILENIENPTLLGGIKIEIGDEVIDATIANKISELQRYLITN